MTDHVRFCSVDLTVPGYEHVTDFVCLKRWPDAEGLTCVKN